MWITVGGYLDRYDFNIAGVISADGANGFVSYDSPGTFSWPGAGGFRFDSDAELHSTMPFTSNFRVLPFCDCWMQAAACHCHATRGRPRWAPALFHPWVT